MLATFTTTASLHTVAPFQTRFTNDSGKVLTLRYQNGTSLVLPLAATSAKISTTINVINCGATNYYADHHYTIPANQFAVLTMVDAMIMISSR